MNELLREFVQTRSAEAFDRLAAGHVNAIYSQCMRQLRDATLAEEVTQLVLITLARKAARIPEGSILEGWLFVTTRYCCANVLRAAARRRSAEERAARMRHEAVDETHRDEELLAQAEPMLDDAIARLGQRDRDAVLLRFFQGRSLREVGQSMGVSEDAAKQRVGRAVEKLRSYFGQRGLAIPSPMIVLWLGDAVKPAAPGVAQAAVHAAMAKSGTATAAYAATWLSRVPWPWPKIAAAFAVAGIIATSVVVKTHDAAANSPTPIIAAAATPQYLDATPATGQLPEQQTPLETLGKLVGAIESGDRSSMNECLCDDGVNLANSALARAVFNLEAGVFHLDQAWRAKFGGPMAIGGVGFGMVPSGTTIDSFLNELLKLSPAPQIQTEGDFAQMRVSLPAELFAGTGPDRIAAFGRWSGAMLVFKHVDNRWKLDTDRTFNFFIQVARQSGNQTDAVVLEQQISDELANSLDAIAQSIEKGSITSRDQAAMAVVSVAKRSDQDAKVNGDNWFALPVIGGTPPGK